MIPHVHAVVTHFIYFLDTKYERVIRQGVRHYISMNQSKRRVVSFKLSILERIYVQSLEPNINCSNCPSALPPNAQQMGECLFSGIQTTERQRKSLGIRRGINPIPGTGGR